MHVHLPKQSSKTKFSALQSSNTDMSKKTPGIILVRFVIIFLRNLGGINAATQRFPQATNKKIKLKLNNSSHTGLAGRPPGFERSGCSMRCWSPAASDTTSSPEPASTQFHNISTLYLSPYNISISIPIIFLEQFTPSNGKTFVLWPFPHKGAHNPYCSWKASMLGR